MIPTAESTGHETMETGDCNIQLQSLHFSIQLNALIKLIINERTDIKRKQTDRHKCVFM